MVTFFPVVAFGIRFVPFLRIALLRSRFAPSMVAPGFSKGQLGWSLAPERSWDTTMQQRLLCAALSGTAAFSALAGAPALWGGPATPASERAAGDRRRALFV